MNKLNIFLLFSLVIISMSNFSFCQTTFTYEIKTLMDERLFDAAEDENGNYYMVGRKLSKETNITSAYYLSLNYEGNLLYEYEFSDPDTMSYFSNVYYKQDSIIIFGAKGLTSGGLKDHLWMVIYDKYFNIIMNKTFLLEGNKISDIESIINSKGNFLICGSVYSSVTSFDIFLFEISSIGDSVKSAILPFNLSQIEFDLIEKDNGGYKVFAWGPFPDAYPSNGNIVNIDSSFNYISADSVPLGLFANHSAKWLNDTTYLLTGKQPQPNTIKTDMGIIKLNSNDQLINATYFGKSGDTSHHVGACSNLDFITKDNIYFGGTSNIFENQLIYQPEPSWILLNNIDSNLNLNWQKFYGGDAFYYLWGIRATNDGGCLMLCTRYDDAVQDEELDIIIFKVDSNGILTGTNSYPPISTQMLTCYPNPASDWIHISFGEAISSWSLERKLVLINIFGEKVIETEIPRLSKSYMCNVSTIPIGIYFVTILERQKVIYSNKVIISR